MMGLHTLITLVQPFYSCSRYDGTILVFGCVCEHLTVPNDQCPQVQTLSTWYEFDYALEMTVGWYVTLYYQLIIFLVGFIVSQLFIAVVCFGFENLEEQLSEPVFSDEVIGLPFVELETDPDDNLCKCLNVPIDPLLGSKNVELDRGSRDGVRVKVNFKYHYYAPPPLDLKGHYEEHHSRHYEVPEVEENPVGTAVGVPTVLIVTNPLHVAVGSDSLEVSAEVDFVGVGSGNGLLHEGDNESPREEDAQLTPKTAQRRTGKQQYQDYRDLMQKWKDEEALREHRQKNAPFAVAQGSAKPREMEFKYESLTTWSNERIWSLHVMLRAQEQIDLKNEIKFYHDLDGQPGQEMGNELLSELVQVENDFEMPVLVVHVRASIKVVVEPLLSPIMWWLMLVGGGGGGGSAL